MTAKTKITKEKAADQKTEKGEDDLWQQFIKNLKIDEENQIQYCVEIIKNAPDYAERALDLLVSLPDNTEALLKIVGPEKARSLLKAKRSRKASYHYVHNIVDTLNDAHEKDPHIIERTLETFLEKSTPADKEMYLNSVVKACDVTNISQELLKKLWECTVQYQSIDALIHIIGKWNTYYARKAWGVLLFLDLKEKWLTKYDIKNLLFTAPAELRMEIWEELKTKSMSPIFICCDIIDRLAQEESITFKEIKKEAIALLKIHPDRIVQNMIGASKKPAEAIPE